MKNGKKLNILIEMTPTGKVINILTIGGGSLSTVVS